jgi:hypothetical protein
MRAAVVRFAHRLIRSAAYDSEPGAAAGAFRQFPFELETAEHQRWSFIIWLADAAVADHERVSRFVATLASMPQVHELDHAAPDMVVVRAGRMSHESMHAAAERAWDEAAGGTES